MSENNLELSKIVNLIMENPSLVAEISSLARGSSQEDTSVSEENTSVTEAPPDAVEAASAIPTVSKQERRAQLLAAMKPYLSEERARTIDTMMSILGVIGSGRGN